MRSLRAWSRASWMDSSPLFTRSMMLSCISLLSWKKQQRISAHANANANASESQVWCVLGCCFGRGLESGVTLLFITASGPRDLHHALVRHHLVSTQESETAGLA